VPAPQWWTQFAFPAYEPETAPFELLNWYIPFMAPYEQAAMGRYLYQAGAANPDVLTGMVTPGYNASMGSAAATRDWLASVSGARTATGPARGTPAEAWLGNLFQAASALQPGMGRAEQRTWRATLDTLLGAAPDEQTAFLGQSLYNPLLRAPEYGQAAPLGQYVMPYRTKGGLVANPWFV